MKLPSPSTLLPRLRRRNLKSRGPEGEAAPKAASPSLTSVLLPLLVATAFLLSWQGAVRLSGSDLFPRPIEVARGIVELVEKGLLFKYIVASLFRVTCGFFLAVLLGVPFGLLLGWFGWAFKAFNPMIQVLRPISPIAWIPVAILWFGVSDAAPVFLIFLASLFPITVSATAAVQNMQLVYLRAARNFALTRVQLFRRVILPATLPQIITGVRIALGVAWLVVVAGMVMIGLIGLVLDLLVRRLEHFEEVSWGYGNR